MTNARPRMYPLSLHCRNPMQKSFVDHDALPCGYCTPGQIMSAVACVEEGHAGTPDQIREYMSGNICRCGASLGVWATSGSLHEVRDFASRKSTASFWHVRRVESPGSYLLVRESSKEKTRMRAA